MTMLNELELKKWKDYQAGVQPIVEKLSDEELDLYLVQLQEVVFEAKAKHHSAYRVKLERDKAKAPKMPVLNRDNGSSPVIQKPKKVTGKSKTDRISSAAALLGFDEDGEDLMKGFKKEKFKNWANRTEKEVKEDLAAKEAAIAAKPLAKDVVNCPYSPSAKHEGERVCKWCGERFV